MQTHSLLTVALAAAVLSAALQAQAQPKIPPKYQAAPMQIVQLPKYCYQQYVDGSLSGYEFSIPNESCGYAMNHFCPALIFMMDAQRYSLPKNERVGAVQHAVNEINYTIREMKPGCFITNDVMAAKEKAAMLSRIIK